MESEILIEARDLSRRYGPALAVSDLNLTLRQGEILGLLGPNGAGKSTTMKMLTGNLSPSTGEVHIKGVSLREEPTAAKKHLGYLPEQPPVYPELTVDEYLRYCAGLHGIASAERAAEVAQSKQSCGLNEVGGRLIGNLSKGYQQRVGLAQAIIHRPSVIVLDEPTVGLDPIQIREIRALIVELGKSHSVILSSHILPEIQAVCSRVMIVNRGRAVYDQPVVATRNAAIESLVVAFKRSPALSALTSIVGVGGVTEIGGGRYRLQLAGGNDPREVIANAAANGNWGLIELAPEVKTLEDIFIALTAGDEQERKAA
jgi:ABC-2 type transport system ATP-binding protein